MWRRVLARCHPDAGGEHELFIWARALYEYVAGGAIGEALEDARTPYERRQPPRHPSSPSGERVPYEEAFGRAGSFGELTRQAVILFHV